MSSIQHSDELYMAECLELSKNSPDPNTKVGACVINNEGILDGKGYNKMPDGTEGLPMKSRKDIPNNSLENKNLYTVIETGISIPVPAVLVVHAEVNAIVNSKGTLRGGTIYTTLFPCNDCAKLIVQCGIKEVVYRDDKKDKNSFKASRRIFEAAKIPVRQIT